MIKEPKTYLNIKMPPSKTDAFKRLKNMEKKIDANEQFAKEHCDKINYYVDVGYAFKLSKDEVASPDPKSWFLPHFGVINQNKPDQFGFVFDAAAKNFGVSLNDVLLK